MRRFILRVLPLAALVAAAALTGCSRSDDAVFTPGSDSQADVQAGAELAALAGPSGDAAGDMILGMVTLLQPAPNVVLEETGAPASVPSCPASFDLGNGISGSCSVSANNVATFLFGGTLTVDGDVVSVDGTLVAGPAEQQPASGSHYLIDYDASASGSRGQASWGASGDVTVDEGGGVIDFSLTLTYTVTPTGKAPRIATVLISPTQFEVVATGPFGGVLRIVLDRSTMSGFVSLNGLTVAQITIVDGCVSVDYLVPEVPSETICPVETA